MAKGHSIDASHFLSPQEEKQLRFLPLGLVKYEKGVSKIYILFTLLSTPCPVTRFAE